MQRLFSPRAIAVVGASPDEGKLSGRPLKYLRRYGFKGPVYPVNPRYSELGGHKCYASVDELPADTDLGLIMLPAPAVAEALEGLGKRGVAYAVSVASGFAEAGNFDLQARLAEICRETDIRLVGPNCVGFINPMMGVTATFSTVIGRAMPPPGGLALVTQSGALGNALLQTFNELHIGLRCWVSSGNEADLGALDFVEYLLEDEQTRAIALFLEGLKQGERLVPLGREARRRGKSLIVLRAGKSKAGREASLSHTGKLSGSAVVWRHLARQAGMVEVESLDDLADMCLGLQVWGNPNPGIPAGLGVLTISGGLGVLISDYCAERSIPVPRFSGETQAKLRRLLPPQSAVTNPVDTALFANESAYAQCARAVIDDPSVGTLLLILTSLGHDYEALTSWLAELAGETKERPCRIAVSFLSSADQLSHEQRRRLQNAGVLVLPDALRVVKVLSGLDYLARWRAPPSEQVMPGGEVPVRSDDDLLDAARIARPAEKLCRSSAEAGEAAAAIGFPVALKISSPDLPHKTEVNGVVLGLQTRQAVELAFDAMLDEVRRRAPHARIEGAVVQEMVDGVELILGGSTDPELGKVVMVGSGGIFAELVDDVTFRAPPLTREDVAEMIGELKCAPLIEGYRGAPKADRAALEDAVLGLAAVFAANPQISEIDINPLIVLPEGRGVRAVDCLVVLKDGDQSSKAGRE